MHIWLQLLARESVFLALLALIGSGPAAYLSDRFDAGARVALAPVLGFCLGSAVVTTILQFAPADSTYWVLAPLAIGSVVLAVWRRRRSSGARHPALISLTPRDVAQLALVCLVVVGPLTYVLHQRNTVGPGDYTFTDGVSYVSEIDGAMTTSTQDAAADWIRITQRGEGRFGDLTQYNWGFRASFNQNLDAAPLEANVTALLGLGATDTFDPFLIVLLLMGALGAFAGVRYVAQAPTWTAVLAGGMFGGAFFLELYFDTYQAAICGLALVVPLVVLGAEIARNQRKTDLALCALVVSGFLTVYPLFVPLVVGALVLVLAVLAVWRRRSGRAVTPYIRPIVLSLVGVAVLASIFEPVAFVRDIHYAEGIINNSVPLPRVGFTLPLDVLPGWLLQTREFWDMPPLGQGGFKQLLLGGVLPLGMLVLVAIALWRYRSTLVLLALAIVCAVVAEYSFASRDACTYCAERNLLPIAPLGAVLVALGVFALIASGSRWAKLVGIVAGVVVVLAVAQRVHVELQRFSNASYFLDTGNRVVLAKLPPGATVQLEGYDAGIQAQAEEGYVYFLANEHVPGRVSVVTATDPYQGLAYLTFDNASVPADTFSPYYDFVLTRLAGIKTARRVIARSGPIALEARARPLDVLPIDGIAVPIVRLDPEGIAFVQGPLAFYLTGNVRNSHVWAYLKFRLSVPVRIPPQRGVRFRQHGQTLTVCAPANGVSPLRIATLSMSASLVPGPVPAGLFPAPVPLHGIALTEMLAAIGSCRP